MQNMVAGDSCTYNILAACGAPGFNLDSSTTMASTNLEVTYVEWNNNVVGSTDVSTSSTPIADRNSTAPDAGAPKRNHVFSYFT